MRISFDLDDTLICYQPGVPRERSPLLVSLFTRDEPLRLGAKALLAELQRLGWELWVYTTSHRDPWALKLWFRLHGVRIGRVINQDTHDRHFGRDPSRPSKNPGAFGIDLHVDDSEGVAIEGRRHGFRVLVIDPADQDWAEKVLSAAVALAPARRG